MIDDYMDESSWLYKELKREFTKKLGRELKRKEKLLFKTIALKSSKM